MTASTDTASLALGDINVEHVVMDCRDLDAVIPQRLHYGIDLLRDQQKVAGDRRLAVAGRLAEISETPKLSGSWIG
jgi:hypothetical protein